ncbi:secondary thiamine-phosphate synthase enzyme YjbQ [Bordetella flabilis]|uniref:Secondary thiamine-phosphate synthase n=1 Tax=Bordetella flabilis TaxID=463014 RepID=A0A193GET6_9BORD|nr:secondary thiamine-phosphate synthase enzyme YjbQ [Bordetella flabilis]ANN78118.1 secondary thiamine-phosphate synthase [Bordetella flabilis]
MRRASPKILPIRFIAQEELEIATPGRGFTELTDAIASLVSVTGIETGQAHVYTRHTSCSLLITENADPQVREDLERYFARLVPDGDTLFRHDEEGPDDMSAHVRTALTGVSLTVPIARGELALGTWQGIYLWEHRTRPHQRQVTVTLTGYGQRQSDNGGA